jgi:hypothetical protein
MTKFYVTGFPVRTKTMVHDSGERFATLILRTYVYAPGGETRTHDLPILAFGRLGEAILAAKPRGDQKITVAGRITTRRQRGSRGGTFPVVQLVAEQWEWADTVAGRLGVATAAEDFTMKLAEIDDDDIGGVEVRW